MDNSLGILYLSVLLGFLAVVAGFVIRQIVKTRQVENQLSKLQKKINSEKGSPLDYYELGSIYLDKKLYSQSIQMFQKALKFKDLEDENLALLYNALGFSYAALEQYDLAIRQYKQALKSQADYVVAWNNLGYSYERKSLTVQALEAYENALKYEPNNETAKTRSNSLRKRVAPSA
jgi:tetratricopeptide (TPR) repeat protein